MTFRDSRRAHACTSSWKPLAFSCYTSYLPGSARLHVLCPGYPSCGRVLVFRPGLSLQSSGTQPRNLKLIQAVSHLDNLFTSDLVPCYFKLARTSTSSSRPPQHGPTVDVRCCPLLRSQTPFLVSGHAPNTHDVRLSNFQWRLVRFGVYPLRLVFQVGMSCIPELTCALTTYTQPRTTSKRSSI